MGMLNRLLGQARSAPAPATTRRTRRTTGRPGVASGAPASRGLGGIARRLMGGRRGGL